MLSQLSCEGSEDHISECSNNTVNVDASCPAAIAICQGILTQCVYSFCMHLLYAQYILIIHSYPSIADFLLLAIVLALKIIPYLTTRFCLFLEVAMLNKLVNLLRITQVWSIALFFSPPTTYLLSRWIDSTRQLQ